MLTGMSRVGILGLGQIGGGAAEALSTRGGHELFGYDVAANVGRAAADVVGLRVVASPTEAASGMDVVLVAVFDDAQVRDAMTAVLAAQPLPRAVVILSTVAVATVQEAAMEAGKAGVGVLDCGVTGGPPAIRRGELVAMVGGDEAAFAIARPVLEGLASPVLHLGPLGSGMYAKLARNLITYGGWYVALEAATFAQAHGVDLKKLIQASEAGDRLTGGMHSILHHVSAFQETPSSESVLRMFPAYVHKDIGAALAAASARGLDLPSARLTDEAFDEAIEACLAASEPRE
jgi:3-hydroxyisobutyrate dehydrogenase-like beta-hydroxyacid dehydrogenase